MFKMFSHWTWAGAILKRWNHSKSWVIFADIRPKNYHHLKEWHFPKDSCVCITLPIKVILHHIYSMGMYILDHYLCYVWKITFLINNTFWKIQDTPFRLSQHKNIAICCKKKWSQETCSAANSLVRIKDTTITPGKIQLTFSCAEGEKPFAMRWSLHAIWRRYRIIRSM